MSLQKTEGEQDSAWTIDNYRLQDPAQLTKVLKTKQVCITESCVTCQTQPHVPQFVFSGRFLQLIPTPTSSL